MRKVGVRMDERGWGLKNFMYAGCAVVLLAVSVGCGAKPMPIMTVGQSSPVPVTAPTGDAYVTTYSSFIHSLPFRSFSHPMLATSLSVPPAMNHRKMHSVPIQVDVESDRTGMNIAPITVDITNAKSNPHPYHQTYAVTNTVQPLLEANRTMNISVPLPPDSGAYEIQAFAKPVNGAEVPGSERAIEVYIDHGGFYRTGKVDTNVKLIHGDFEVDVVGVTMTRESTQIHYILRALHRTSGAWGDGEGEVTMNVPTVNGTTAKVRSMLGDTRGAVQGNIMDTTKFADPTWSDTQSLTMTFDRLGFASDKGDSIQSGPFSVTVPLATPK